MLIDQKVKKLTELLLCTFAMFDQAARGCLYRRECPYGFINPISNFYQVLSPSSSISQEKKSEKLTSTGIL